MSHILSYMHEFPIRYRSGRSMLEECSKTALFVVILIVNSEDIINGNRNSMIFSQKCLSPFLKKAKKNDSDSRSLVPNLVISRSLYVSGHEVRTSFGVSLPWPTMLGVATSVCM